MAVDNRRMPPPLYVPEHLVVHKDTHQAHVMIGSRGYNAYDDKRTALYLLNNILGWPGHEQPPERFSPRASRTGSITWNPT